jgi:hypothetical protein
LRTWDGGAEALSRQNSHQDADRVSDIGREAEDADPEGEGCLLLLWSAVPLTDPIEPEAGQKELYSSWALFILIMLLITALFSSYLLQQKRIQAVHETVISIFAGSLPSPLESRNRTADAEFLFVLVFRHGCWTYHSCQPWAVDPECSQF